MAGPIFYGARIKAARNKLGLSADKFAEIAGVARSTQMNYESGKSLPSIDYLEKCLAAGVSISDLLPTASMSEVQSKILDSSAGDLPVGLHAALERHLPALRAGGSTTPLYEELWHLFRASLPSQQQ